MAEFAKKEKNYAFIDGQNTHFGTTKCHVCAETLNKELKHMRLVDCSCGTAWKIDMAKFRIYLRDKYGVSQAYYFLGYIHSENEELYNKIQEAGFIVAFKEHHQRARSAKKGNVDTDIVFEVMRDLLEEGQNFDKVVLVSGDGDYKKLVQYLLNKGRFKKLLFPNKKFASSLYNQYGSEVYDYLENLKAYIERVKQ